MAGGDAAELLPSPGHRHSDHKVVGSGHPEQSAVLAGYSPIVQSK